MASSFAFSSTTSPASPPATLSATLTRLLRVWTHQPATDLSDMEVLLHDHGWRFRSMLPPDADSVKHHTLTWIDTDLDELKRRARKDVRAMMALGQGSADAKDRSPLEAAASALQTYLSAVDELMREEAEDGEGHATAFGRAQAATTAFEHRGVHVHPCPTTNTTNTTNTRPTTADTDAYLVYLFRFRHVPNPHSNRFLDFVLHTSTLVYYRIDCRIYRVEQK